MKRFIASLSLAATAAFGASLPSTLNTIKTLNNTQLQGDYVEARTADVYTGPCYANSEVDLVGNLAVFGWKVNKGNWQGVKLDGLSVVGVVKAASTLGNVNGNAYPVKSVLIVDERANPEQRLALQSFAKRMGGDLLQDVVNVDYAPVDLTFANNDLHSRKATLTAGTLASIQTRALNEGDNHCSNEITWYPPLTKLDHSMPAYALAHTFNGKELGTTWSSPEKRSAFVGQFHLSE
jgi:hypothetical protein